MFLSPHVHNLFHHQHAPAGWDIAIVGDHLLTYHCHPQSTVYMRTRSWGHAFYESRQMCMTCVYHCNIQSILTACKTISSLPVHPSPQTPIFFIVFVVVALSECPVKVGITQYVAFHIGFFDLVLR